VRWVWPWQGRDRRFSWVKAGALALVLLPAARTARLVGAGDYGTVAAIVLNGLTYWSGVWATVVLLAALMVTPAAVILRWPALTDTRRMIGVAALAYTVVHLVMYFSFRSFDFAFIAGDMLRLSMVVAVLAAIGLIVLGATSVDAAVGYLGRQNWQRLHTANYAISGLAIVHVVLARGTYAEQYMLTGVFFWLMAWRVLTRHQRGADVRMLFVLAVASCVFTASLEAGFLWGRRGFDVVKTLGYNFSLAMLDFYYPPAWQVLAFGLFVTLAAVGHKAVVRAGRRRSDGPASVPHVRGFQARFNPTNLLPARFLPKSVRSATEDTT
jgi:methionine sulfoxide reductase heme-binding subunit